MDRWKGYLPKLSRTRIRLKGGSVWVTAGNVCNLVAYRFDAATGFNRRRTGDAGDQCSAIFLRVAQVRVAVE